MPSPAGTKGATPSDAFLLAAIDALWPHQSSDSEHYLAAVVARIMAVKRDPKGQLPPHVLHLTDVGGFLRQLSASDPRLADVFPRNAHAHMAGFKKPKLSEFLLVSLVLPF